MDHAGSTTRHREEPNRASDRWEITKNRRRGDDTRASGPSRLVSEERHSQFTKKGRRFFFRWRHRWADRSLRCTTREGGDGNQELWKYRGTPRRNTTEKINER